MEKEEQLKCLHNGFGQLIFEEAEENIKKVEQILRTNTSSGNKLDQIDEVKMAKIEQIMKQMNVLFNLTEGSKYFNTLSSCK